MNSTAASVTLLHHIQFQKVLAHISYFCVSVYLIIALILVILPFLFHEGVFVAGGRGSVNGVSSLGTSQSVRHRYYVT
jgi:hypothetical protein